MAPVTINTVTLFWGGLSSSPPTPDSWRHRQRLSFWPIKLTHICQLPMYHLLSELHQPVMNGPASSAQYDSGWLVVRRWDAWQELSEQDNSANVHHLVRLDSNFQHRKNRIWSSDWGKKWSNKCEAKALFLLRYCTLEVLVLGYFHFRRLYAYTPQHSSHSFAD